MDQYGSADRDQFNVAGDMYLLTGHDIGTTDIEDAGWETTRSDSDSDSGAGIIAFLLIAAIIGFFFWNSSQSGGSLPRVPFPLHGSSWPAGATATAVMAPVIVGLQDCARAPVLAPANCPQSQTAAYPGVARVRWSLHGDPADGARIVYRKNKFNVAGNTIMLVTYSDATRSSDLNIEIVHYRAQLSWHDNRAILLGIQGVSAVPGPTIIKHTPDVTWSQVQEVVRSAFFSCAAMRSVPLPPQCPTGPNSNLPRGSGRWHLKDDPLLNARETFNRNSGLIHVTGSYAMSVTYSELPVGKEHYTEAGNYNATVSDDQGKLDVLQLTAS